MPPQQDMGSPRRSGGSLEECLEQEEEEERAEGPQGPTDAAPEHVAVLGWESEGAQLQEPLTSMFQFKAPEVNDIYMYLNPWIEF